LFDLTSGGLQIYGSLATLVVPLHFSQGLSISRTGRGLKFHGKADGTRRLLPIQVHSVTRILGEGSSVVPLKYISHQ
jgi:hypothetical protein